MKLTETDRINVQADKYSVLQQGKTDQKMDSESQNVQNQIASEQNRLKSLSADNKKTDEEKRQERQEIQKKITELNNQLRQRQMELRREQQLEKDKRAEELPKGKQEEKPDTLAEETDAKKVIASQNSTKAIVSADTAIRQAKAQGTLAKTMENRARVLEGEIKQDASRGKNTEYKEKELKTIEKKAANIKGSQAGIISDANREMRKAAAQDNQNDKKTGQEQKKGTDLTLTVAVGASGNKTDMYQMGKVFSSVNLHV